LRAAVVFGGPVRLAIHALKYNARLPLARPLAQLLATSLHNQPWQIDALVPVPLHANRQRTRGFNQSLLLARELARQTGLPMWTQALARVRDTPTQTLLGAEQRRENVHAAFRGTEARIKTRSILIVDDVLTTGATLDACAQALVAAGARHVWGLAVARPL
jgi:ComF family protein